MNLDFRLWPAEREKGEESRNGGWDDDIAAKVDTTLGTAAQPRTGAAMDV